MCHYSLMVITLLQLTHVVQRKYNELEDRIPWFVRQLLGLNADKVAREASKRCGVSNGKYTRKDVLACALKHQDEVCPYISQVLDIIGCDTTSPPIPLIAAKRNLGSVLEMGRMMYAGDYLVSDNGEYRLIMEGEAQMGLYMSNDERHINALWKTPTWYMAQTQNVYAVLQTNGNLELRKGVDGVLWETNTKGSEEDEYHLKVTDYGSLIISNKRGATIWQSSANIGIKDEL